MATESEGVFKIDDTSLYTKTWLPTGPTRAKVVFFHGYSDHMGRYYGLFPHLAERGIAVYGIDQRGWGRSVQKVSERGLTGPTPRVIADMVAFIKDRLATPPDVPLFVMGHSMGGGQVLTLASDPAYDDLLAQVRGWILESPFLAFPAGEEPSNIKVFLGKLVGRLLPHHQLYSPLPAKYFSRDPAVVENILADTLCHNTGTLEGLAGLLERSLTLEHGRSKLSPKVKSMYVTHGTADKTCSYDVSKKWFDAQTMEDGQFKPMEGGYHQLHSDLCKDEFYKNVSDWILARSEVKESAKL